MADLAPLAHTNQNLENNRDLRKFITRSKAGAWRVQLATERVRHCKLGSNIDRYENNEKILKTGAASAAVLMVREQLLELCKVFQAEMGPHVVDMKLRQPYLNEKSMSSESKTITARGSSQK